MDIRNNKVKLYSLVSKVEKLKNLIISSELELFWYNFADIIVWLENIKINSSEQKNQIPKILRYILIDKLFFCLEFIDS
ncbi:hypothetical protein KQ878_00305 [Mycoplasma zalophidermidis]|uniref:Uncharacterized protein n=1 Tax=Mycoplasma zalophidermidis TaxID=398174 RepID=A0ABS6DQP5_9MOLU|nr:hypothetical protein [Mycoplasma zalophidermidis]MBU4693327.1 hypothetical protein [Mycoplasma zalophidermidis]